MRRLDFRSALVSGASALAIVSLGTSAAAYDEPTVNLGLTTFMDGALPSGSGLYYQNYLEYYTTGRFNDGEGRRLTLPRQDLDVVADINQFTYYFKNTVGPGRFALDLVIPTVASADVNDGLGGRALTSRTGLGDIFFAPIYEFEPVHGPWGTLWLQSLEFDVLAPTGAYSRRAAINPGNNAWALNPFYSVTVIPARRLSLSARIHYLYNFTNTDPDLSYGPNVQSVQAGQAFHLNFAAGYAITPRLTAGLNGYYFIQTTDTRFNGTDAPGRRERVLGLGPGVFYTLNKDTFLISNLYFEMAVRNRTRGERMVFRLVHHF